VLDSDPVRSCPASARGRWADLIAEGIVQVGGIAEGTVRAAVKRSRLPEYPLAIASGREHVEVLSHSLA